MHIQIKSLLSFTCLFALGMILPASEPTEIEAEIPLLMPEELEELLGPIALYPDSVIALILPACTAPTDIVRAARFIESHPNSSQIDTMPWDESVIALAHYPDVIRELDGNLEWAIQVGDAFIAQPEDVMRTVQRLRARARALGHLDSDPHQSIIAEDEVIRIVPRNPEVVYIPTYDTRVVYVDRYVGVPSLHYATWFGVGSWMCYDLDWISWNLRVVKPHWRNHWYQTRPWHNPDYHRRDPFWSHRDRYREWTPRRPFKRDFRNHSTRSLDKPRDRSYHQSYRDSPTRPTFNKPQPPRRDTFRNPEPRRSPSKPSFENRPPDRRFTPDNRATPRPRKDLRQGLSGTSNRTPERTFRKHDSKMTRPTERIHSRPSFESKRPNPPSGVALKPRIPDRPPVELRSSSGSSSRFNRDSGSRPLSSERSHGRKRDR